VSLRVPAAAARRLAIENQGLAGPAPRRRADPAALLATCRKLRCLQLDPTSVVARSHLLVLFSRHGPFAPEAFEQLAYGERSLFEYWAHEASYVLAEDLPLHRWAMERPPRSTLWHERIQAWWDDNADFRAHILARLGADGPLRAREIEDRSTRPWQSTGWTHERNVARMLDVMWVRGQVGIARREGGQRLWDLLERCLPLGAPEEAWPQELVVARAAELAVRALGVARAPHVRAHFTRGRYPGLDAAPAAGPFVPVTVEGLGEDWWVHEADVERLEALAGGDEFRPRTALLSPFDNLICDRARTEALWGFAHRLEIYVPKPQRRWGYFVLPVLDGDRLVARADLQVDRRARRLLVHALHAEPRVPRGARLPGAIRTQLERVAAWQGAGEIEVRLAPERWRPVLAA
jgi:uncharacterized protein